jgi:hypothetical protein
MTIHRLAHTLTNRGADHIRAQIEDPGQLSSLQAIEITQYVVFWSPAGRPADTDPAAREVRASTVFQHRAKPIVASGAAADFQPNDPKVEVELVMDAHDSIEGHLEELHGGLNGLPAQVHEGHRLEKHHLVGADRDLGELTLELVSKARGTPAPRQLVHHHESNIVAICGVLRAGVSEADDEMRAHGPPGV